MSSTLIGHGGFDPNTDEGLIALADEDGKTHNLSATLLGRLLTDHRFLRLVLLNSCEGARGSERDIFSSTASILVRRGIPAVLAMQYEITDRTAIEFARAFYEALADGMPVDTAVAEARKAISLAVTNTVEWGTPVLYMRSPDGALFSIQEQEAEAERLEQERQEREAREKAAREEHEGKAHEKTTQEWVSLSQWTGAPTVRILRTLKGHTKQVNSVAFSPDGATLASASWGTVWLWRVSDGEILRTFEIEKGTSVAFSPDGKILASGASSVWLWRVSDGKLLHRLEGHKNKVNSVAFSPDGTNLASGSDDQTVRLWRLK